MLCDLLSKTLFIRDATLKGEMSRRRCLKLLFWDRLLFSFALPVLEDLPVFLAVQEIEGTASFHLKRTKFREDGFPGHSGAPGLSQYFHERPECIVGPPGPIEPPGEVRFPGEDGRQGPPGKFY